MVKKQQPIPISSGKKTSIQSGILKVLGAQKYLEPEEAKTLILEHFKRSDGAKAALPQFAYSVQRSLDRLIEAGEIVTVKSGSVGAKKHLITLSDSGRQKLQHQSFDLSTSIVPTMWDGKWRIVLLDFPEYQKQDRDTMRYLLKKARFVCLKKSVWVSPFPYEEYLQSLKQNLPSSDAVICIVAETIDPEIEVKLLEHFRLVRQ